MWFAQSVCRGHGNVGVNVNCRAAGAPVAARISMRTRRGWSIGMNEGQIIAPGTMAERSTRPKVACDRGRVGSATLRVGGRRSRRRRTRGAVLAARVDWRSLEHPQMLRDNILGGARFHGGTLKDHPSGI